MNAAVPQSIIFINRESVVKIRVAECTIGQITLFFSCLTFFPIFDLVNPNVKIDFGVF